MRTTLDIDEALLKMAMSRARARTKTETVERGLRELIQAQRRQSLIQSHGAGYGMNLRSFLGSRKDE